jgi:glycine reductase complex component B subunit alpha and beta
LKGYKEIQMRLQLDILNIKDVQFGDRTRITDGVLYINRQELQEFLKEDKRLSRVDIELAHPGEKCRIIQASDVAEPRAKTKGGVDFPGALGKQGTVGQGNTCVLRGTAVVASEYRREGDPPMQPGFPRHGRIIDMSGPGAELSIYGKTHNIVLVPWPANEISVQEYRIALKIAELKTAVYLAKAGKDLKPDEIEVYELTAPSKIEKGLEHLPKVAYIFQFIPGQFETIPGYPVLYGSNASSIVPTILHPNEILDGAMVTPYRTMAIDVFGLQNHSIIKELYQRHGKDLCFAGVIITVGQGDERENERAAIMSANLAKWVLGADGVVLTKSGGGIPEVPLALTAQRCEELGVRTSVAITHYPADVGDADGSILFNAPEVDAIVSLGTPWNPITLPPVERIIGEPAAFPEGPPVDGPIETTFRWMKGIFSQIGNSRLIAVRY